MKSYSVTIQMQSFVFQHFTKWKIWKRHILVVFKFSDCGYNISACQVEGSNVRLTTLLNVNLSVSQQMSKFPRNLSLDFFWHFFGSYYFLFHTCYKCFVSPKQKRQEWKISSFYETDECVILISYQNSSYYYYFQHSKITFVSPLRY